MTPEDRVEELASRYANGDAEAEWSDLYEAWESLAKAEQRIRDLEAAIRAWDHTRRLRDGTLIDPRYMEIPRYKAFVRACDDLGNLLEERDQ